MLMVTFLNIFLGQVGFVKAVLCRPFSTLWWLTLPGSSVSLPLLSQYADDTSVVVSSNAAITATFDLYDLYEQGSGAKLNLSKCKGL